MKLYGKVREIFLDKPAKYQYLFTKYIDIICFFALVMLYSCKLMFSKADTIYILIYISVIAAYYIFKRKNCKNKVMGCIIFIIRYLSNIIIMLVVEINTNVDSIVSYFLGAIILFIILILLSEIILLLDNKPPIYFYGVILLVLAFTQIGIDKVIFDWLVIYLIILSFQEILTIELSNLNKDNDNLEEFKERIIRKKYLLLILTPVIYLSLKMIDFLINLECVRKILDNAFKGGNWIRIILLGELKCIIILIPLAIVYSFRLRIIKIVRNYLIYKKW